MPITIPNVWQPNTRAVDGGIKETARCRAHEIRIIHGAGRVDAACSHACIFCYWDEEGGGGGVGSLRSGQDIVGGLGEGCVSVAGLGTEHVCVGSSGGGGSCGGFRKYE